MNHSRRVNRSRNRSRRVNQSRNRSRRNNHKVNKRKHKGGGEPWSQEGHYRNFVLAVKKSDIGVIKQELIPGLETWLHQWTGENFKSIKNFTGDLVNQLDEHGNTLLHIIIESIIVGGFSPHSRSPPSPAEARAAAREAAAARAAAAAAEKEKINIAKILIRAGANLEAIDNDGSTPLHSASKANSTLLIAKTLIDEGANLEAVDNDGNTPLHIAIENKRSKVAEFLIKAGANIDAIEGDGNTPLHLAIIFKEQDIANMLINRGANLEAENENGKTPLQLAQENSMINLLNTEMEVSPVFTQGSSSSGAGEGTDTEEKYGLE